MDTDYLKKNVLGALTEALTAMAAESPEDQVEFLGKYLVCYTERSEVAQQKKKIAEAAEITLSQCAKKQQQEEEARREKDKPKDQLSHDYSALLGSLRSLKSKDEAMQKAVDFLETKMSIPSAYMAVRVQSESGEYLKYLHAGPRSTKVAGQKLSKPSTEESEDAPVRQGVSFEAFKLPEVVQEEAEGEEEDANKPKPPPPELSPLIVQNAMRDSRVKFFGFPRLGAFAAFPATYQSGVHDQACVLTAGEEGAAAQWSIAKKEAALLLCVDTVGQFRLFEKEEIDRCFLLVKSIALLCEQLDEEKCAAQLEFLNANSLQTLNDKAAELAATLPEKEAAAIAATANQLQAATTTSAVEGEETSESNDNKGEEANKESEDPQIAELRKQSIECAAALSVYRDAIVGSELSTMLTSSLSKFVLPLPSHCVKLLYAIALIVNESAKLIEDVCGEPDWDAIRSSFLPALVSKIGSFSGSSAHKLTSKSNSVAFVKSFVENNALADTAAYPSFLSVFAVILLPWLQKAIAAREAEIALRVETKSEPIESM